MWYLSNAIPLLVEILAFRSNSPYYLLFLVNSETRMLHYCGKTSTSFESQPVSRQYRLLFVVVFLAPPSKFQDTTPTYGKTLSFQIFSITRFHYSSHYWPLFKRYTESWRHQLQRRRRQQAVPALARAGGCCTAILVAAPQNVTE